MSFSNNQSVTASFSQTALGVSERPQGKKYAVLHDIYNKQAVFQTLIFNNQIIYVNHNWGFSG